MGFNLNYKKKETIKIHHLKAWWIENLMQKYNLDDNKSKKIWREIMEEVNNAYGRGYYKGLNKR